MKHLLNWLRRKPLEHDLNRELQYHLERRIADLKQSGLSPAEAHRQAVLEMGGITQIQEDVRDIWLTRWLRDFIYDLRFSLRSLKKSPSFTLTAVLSLTIGIGATTAIYSLVDQILLHALPVRDPAQLVLIDWKGDQVANGFGTWNLMSYPICRDLDHQTKFFDGVFCRALDDVNLSTGAESFPAKAELVSANYFSVLGVGPSLGSVITQDDDRQPNTNPVAVISYDFWKTQMAGAPNVVGRTLLVNRNKFTIIGVAAKTFHGIDVGEVPSLWLPASMFSEAIPGSKDLTISRTRWLQVLGRLKVGVSPRQAQAGLQPWFKARLADNVQRADFPVTTAERRQAFLRSTLAVTAAPQGHSSLRRRLVQPLWVLFAVTAVLLGLACLNVSGLFLARGSAREREIGTRLALGASRGRLGRQLLTDSLLIALIGGLLGVAIAPLAVKTLLAFLPQNAAANALHSAVDSRLLLFAFSISLLAGVISGFAPSLQSGRQSMLRSMRERGGSAFGGVRLRKWIVTAQIALTLTLVVGAALFVETLDALITKGPGFVTTSLVSFVVDSRRNGYSQSDGDRLIRRIEDKVAQAPIVQSSALVQQPLLTGGSWNDPMTILADKRITTDNDVNINAVTPGFFKTMGIKLVAGRNFDQRDLRPPGEKGWLSAIVNQAFVKRYLQGRNPLGLLICEGSGPDATPNIQIVGVMSNFSYRGLREDSEQAYFPFLQGDAAAAAFYLRVRGTPEASFPALRAIVRNVDPTLAITDLRTVDEQLDRSLNTEHLLATLSGSFSALALLLSLVGLYGVMSFVVTQRTREIGIRLALGARRSAAVWLILRDAFIMIASGIAIGFPFIWTLGRLIESQLYEVKPADPSALALAIVILGLASFGAALIPARRASGVNPTEALRTE